MDKLLAFAVVLSIAIYVHGETATSGTSEELITNIKLKMVQNYLKEQRTLAALVEKTEKMCPGYGNKLESVVKKVERCTNDIDEDNETMCSGMKNHFERCMKPVVEMFEECLPQKSKDIPTFVIKSLLGVVRHLCKTDGEHIFELSNPCARSSNYRTQRCARRIQTKLQQYTSDVPDKQQICQFMDSFKGCLKSHLTASCGHIKTREAFLDLYDAATEPCGHSYLNEVEVNAN